jgi:SPP1 gp7 family putative phage head morphogenesis protein
MPTKNTYDEVYEKSKAYWDKRERMLNQSFNKTNNQILQELKKEYQRVWKDIELEISKWYARNINDINFKWSELHNLEDTQRAIELLLDELYDIEKERLSESMDELYVSTYQDMNGLTQSYFNGLDRAVPSSENIMLTMIQETNRVASMTGLESLIRKEIDTTFLSKRIWDADDILKHPLDWYKGFAGSNFNNRIDRRRAIVKNEINQAIRNAFVQGSSVDRCTKDVLDRLNVSYSNAKRLAHNELTYTQHCADSRQMKENGFKGVKRKIVDSNACEICKEKARNGEIIPIEEYEKNPNVFMLHVNDRCYGVPVMSLDGNSSFRKFAEKYDKEQAKK